MTVVLSLDVPAGEAGSWAVDLMETLGAPGVAIATALESLFPTVPSELVLLLGGFAVRQGELTYLALLIWSTVGSVVGAVAHYYVGAALGRRRTRALFARIPLVRDSDLDRAEAWFARHGDRAVFLCRLVPIVRSYVSLPAGIERMRLGRFVAYTAAGTALWNAVLLAAGWAVGHNWATVQRFANLFTLIVGVLLLVAVVRFVVVRLRSRRNDLGQPKQLDG
ncbi:DedA family protein [Micromonospora sp. NPDC048898]|uniref:DedA family protein n=1 Tax=Micromonospora sp. NPDC048898 TaxID=3364260 RepID=UPI00371138F9